jgi:uncharacterized membrane protein YhaH (DUF805 family)
MTTLYLLSSLVASVYGAGPYDSDVYNGSSTSGAAGGGSSLTNTGILIAFIAGTAALLMLIAVMVRVWHRANRKAKETAAAATAVEPTSGEITQ